MPSKNLVLVTVAAGFIGFHLSQKLCNQGYKVIGLDDVIGYYGAELKKACLSVLNKKENRSFAQFDLTGEKGVNTQFSHYNFNYEIISQFYND
jgi:UDP-glucuronate 4-epimerase